MNIGYKEYSIQMRKPPEIGFLGVWSKQTRLSGVRGEKGRNSWGS